MAKNIEPTLKLISSYLQLQKSENFIIPEYQRGYSWDIHQCDKLWQDIESFIQSNAKDPYFFGTIIVDCSEPNKFSLIDGQQRTTTFLLLLKALLIRLNSVIKDIPNDEDSEPIKAGLISNRNKIMSILYKAEPEDIPSMIKDASKTKNILIIENKSINELHNDEMKKIIESQDFDSIEQNVYKLSRKQKDNKYTNHFRNFKFFFNKLEEKKDTQLNQFAKIFLEKCQVIEIRSWQIEQAITMFNSLNSTGMPLSDADIISGQLYSNSGDYKFLFNEQWTTINKLASELSNRKISNIDSILQQFMYINRAIDKSYITTKDDGSLSIDVTTPGIRRYFTDIEKSLLSEPLSLCEKLYKITKTWDIIKDYPQVKLLLKFNENAKLFLSSYLYRFHYNELNENIVNEVCDPLLRLFTILEISDTGFSSSKFKTFLFGENVKLVDKSIPLSIIEKNFSDHISKNWNKDSVKELINQYDDNILVFLNEYIYSKSKNVRFTFDDNVNIEHIMPQSGRNISSIQKDANINSKEEFMFIVNKLGNKILLEQDINKSIGNEWFKTKKQNTIQSKMGYKDSKYTIASSLSNYPNDNWTSQDIELMNQKIVDRITNFIFDSEI